MDGPHDLGGKASFGPIDIAAPEFRHDWERKMWALDKLVRVPGINIDWWRHGIETMHPAVYLTLPHLEKWCLNDMAHGIEAGLFTMSELTKGHADTPATPARSQSVDELEARQRGMNASFAVETDIQPAFRPGDTVRTKARPAAGHTRLPAYARAASGTVTAHHGAHLFPDAGAEGREVGQHLYTVEFRAADLWPGAEDPADSVCLDLWESYLERP